MSFYGPQLGGLRPTHWLPFFTGAGLLLAILTVFMWGNLALGILMVVIAALPVVLVVYVHQRLHLYRYGPEGTSEAQEDEPLDPITGRPD